MKKLAISILLLTIFILPLYAEIISDHDIKIIMDSKDVTDEVKALIIDGRTMVPLRMISEKLGAEVIWHPETRSVDIKKEDKKVSLFIDNRIIKYNDGVDYQLTDVKPIIVNDRTFVPLRLISNALNISIQWDENTRSVLIDSSAKGAISEFYDAQFIDMNNGYEIKSKMKIKVSSKYKDLEKRLFLLNPITGKGFIVSRTFTDEFTYLPKIEDKGHKVLAFGIYKDNQFITGDAIDVFINVEPSISFDVENSGNAVKVKTDINFLAKYIDYEFTSLDTNKTFTVEKRDPHDIYTWYPNVKDNGNYALKIISYDGNNNPYHSESKEIKINASPYLRLRGVKKNMTVNRPISMYAGRNFDVTETEFFMKKNNKEIPITTIPWGSCKWFPKDISGVHELYVRVKDVKGKVYTSKPVSVTIDGKERLILRGIGPNQVITKDVELTYDANIPLESVYYIVEVDGKKYHETSKLIIDEIDLKNGFNNAIITAYGIYEGKLIESESIAFRMYNGKLYGAKPVIEKDKFKEFASALAVKSYQKTSMAASLQTAQAILETAWGQKLPSDKYSGKFSYNLFGIKGSATNGYVISNTWEVYNGKSYRVDAKFRAYNNVEESWLDHKRLLLEKSRYKPFRDVMYDSTLGAYAIRRCGYATDPRYPIKLINIIEKYDLKKLDLVGIE